MNIDFNFVMAFGLLMMGYWIGQYVLVPLVVRIVRGR
jgi:hypothetical protein